LAGVLGVLGVLGDFARDSLLAFVHTSLGPGWLESVYEAALAYELEKRGLSITRQQGIPVVYEAVRIDAGFSQTWWWRTR
jgi:GxxExxY protein